MKKYRILAIALAIAATSAQVARAEGVEQLMKTKFHQNAPFNNACPNNFVTGCGAIAVTQILKFYGQPTHGFGRMAYKSSNIADSLRLDFDAMAFDWANVLDEYPAGSYSDVQADAVARIAYACGTAMYSNYGKSTAVNNYARMMFGLQHYLHISPESRYVQRKYYSTEEWTAMLDGNLMAGHPVFYRGSWLFDGQNVGHMFVIDGLNAEGDYHVNFGHGNSQDKYASLQVINQSGNFAGGRPVCYNAGQAMVINCYPTPDCGSYPAQQCMSDEAIILNGDYNLRETTVGLGEVFTLSCRLRNISHEKASIKFGWALVKDGERLEQISEQSYGLSPGNTFTQAVQTQMALPKGLGDGEYSLRLFSRSNLEPEWQPVVDNAPSTVTVSVSGGRARVLVPDNHQGNPKLYLVEDIKEVETEMSSTVPGRTFLLHIASATTNNFENTVRLEVETDGGQYTYDAVLPVYSQTQTRFHVTIPQEKADMAGKSVLGVKASYYYDKDDRYYELCTGGFSSIADMGNRGDATTAGRVSVYNANGILVGSLDNGESQGGCARLLRSLPRGMYIIKVEGRPCRKVFNL